MMKVCSRTGQFETKITTEKFEEPKRCRHKDVEYCNGEIVRGFHSMHLIQYCRNGNLQLTAMGKRGFHSAMKMFLPED